MEKNISNYLLTLGFVPNKTGYRYIVDLIAAGMRGRELLPLKYIGYVRIAEKYGKTVAAVEKDIQNAISAAWLKGDVDVLYGEFGETIDMRKGKPSNKQFIMTALLSLQFKNAT